jgi:hypothetical protein
VSTPHWKLCKGIASKQIYDPEVVIEAGGSGKAEGFADGG